MEGKFKNKFIYFITYYTYTYLYIFIDKKYYKFSEFVKQFLQFNKIKTFLGKIVKKKIIQNLKVIQIIYAYLVGDEFEIFINLILNLINSWLIHVILFSFHQRRQRSVGLHAL